MDPKIGPRRARVGPGPGGAEAYIFIGRVDRLVPGPAGRGGDHFGHPQAAQVKALSSRFWTDLLSHQFLVVIPEGGHEMAL